MYVNTHFISFHSLNLVGRLMKQSKGLNGDLKLEHKQEHKTR